MMNPDPKLQSMPQSRIPHNSQHSLKLILCHMQEIRGSFVGSSKVDEVEGCKAGLSPVGRDVRGVGGGKEGFDFF